MNSVVVLGHLNRLHIWVRMKIDLISVMGSNQTWFLCGGSKETWFTFGYRSWLFCAGGHGNFFGVCSTITMWFSCMGRNWYGFWVGIAIDLLFFGPKTAFCVGGRNWLDFCLSAGNHFVLVWASKLTSFLCRLSKRAWFRCRRSNLTWFLRWDRNWLAFGLGVDNYLFLVFGSDYLGFYVEASKLTRI